MKCLKKSNGKIVQWGRINTKDAATNVKFIDSKTKLVNVELQCSQINGFTTFIYNNDNSIIRVGCLKYLCRVGKGIFGYL